jgi:hypothetical protein
MMLASPSVMFRFSCFSIARNHIVRDEGGWPQQVHSGSQFARNPFGAPTRHTRTNAAYTGRGKKDDRFAGRLEAQIDD